MKKLWITIVGFFCLYFSYSILKYLRFEMNIFDLGYYDQLVWLASRGQPLYSSILENHSFVDHVSPTLFLLAPIYRVWSSPIILLFTQSLLVVLGAVPIYKLGMLKLKNTNKAYIVSLCYLGFYGIANALSYEFHPFTLAAPFLATIFHLYETRRFRLFWITFILFLGLQENFFLLGAAYGVFLILQYRDFKRGSVITLGSIVGLFFLLYVFIPKFGSGYYYTPTTLSYFFYPSLKLAIIFVSLLSFAFLPVWTPAIFVLLLEEWVGRFVLTPSITRWGFLYQYNATIAPIMAYGAILSLKKLKLKYINIFLAGGTLVSLFIVRPEITRVFSPKFWDLSFTTEINSAINRLPSDASVAATNNLGSHLAQRKDLIFLTNCLENKQKMGVGVKRCFDIVPQYIVADLREGEGSNNYYPDYSKSALKQYIETVQKEKKYKLEYRSGEIYLLSLINEE